MPEPLWIYRMALRYFPNITTCSAIADAFDSVCCFGSIRATTPPTPEKMRQDPTEKCQPLESMTFPSDKLLTLNFSRFVAAQNRAK